MALKAGEELSLHLKDIVTSGWDKSDQNCEEGPVQDVHGALALFTVEFGQFLRPKSSFPSSMLRSSSTTDERYALIASN